MDFIEEIASWLDNGEYVISLFLDFNFLLKSTEALDDGYPKSYAVLTAFIMLILNSFWMC